ncbi:DNA-processing protein DprA [Ruminococcus sp.]|uniref:DNA-processing protein DprA n=1 Tax=Ruminococcus sp. TaxID=41978 RepID=UPI0038906221
MTNATKYDIWLSLALGYAKPKRKALASLYPQLADFYRGGEGEWRLSGVLSEADIAALHQTPLSKAYEVIARCNELGVGIVSYDDPLYPQRLREIFNPPAVLYLKGRMPDFEGRLSIGMVGTRNATAYGKQTSHVLAGSLAKVGVIIVSGGALGIDSLSHTAALEVGGLTVCVLGCGINYPYLSTNAGLRKTIAQTGVVLSEYPPDYPPARHTFIDRNRLISGLSDGVLVVEAGLKSGSLITARTAVEQNRDVFAVMGNITAPYSQGTNKLIKDGAVPVTDYTDILSYYPRLRLSGEPDDIVEDIPVHKSDIDVSDEARQVYRAVSADPVHIDAITAAVGLPVQAVLRALTELELEELIKAEKGRMYRLV